MKPNIKNLKKQKIKIRIGKCFLFSVTNFAWRTSAVAAIKASAKSAHSLRLLSWRAIQVSDPWL
ncbi:MAG: hypothetical protein ACI8V2_002672 [Candidatus Latescibacterota bacterium]|jgi:hypothetical protein